MVDRIRVTSGAPWEELVGYSRAIRMGSHIYVAGTIGIDEDGTLAADARTQTRRALEIIDGALGRAGARLQDVVRTRLFVTDIEHWEAIGRAHGEVFSDVRPASTMIEVKRLIRSDALVEIEADAVVDEALESHAPQEGI